jgi:hypothetical protein
MILHLLIQIQSPYQEFFWSPYVTFLHLYQIRLGVLVFVIHGYFQRSKLHVILFLLLLCFHSKIFFQFIIEEYNGSSEKNVLLLPRSLQDATIILIIVDLLAINHHLFTFALRGMGVILLCPMHLCYS